MQNDIRILELKNQVLELQDDLFYTNAQVKILQAAQTCIRSYILDAALKFVRANKLGGYDNYFSAGLYIEEAILDEYGFYNEADSCELLNLKEWLSNDEGLFIVIGQKVLREAENFLYFVLDNNISLNEHVELNSDGESLSFLMDDEMKEDFLKDFENLDFNELDEEYKEAETSCKTRVAYFSFKCLIKELKYNS